MNNLKVTVCYLCVFVVSVFIGSWLCKYTRLYSEEPGKIDIIKKQIRDVSIPHTDRLGVFVSLQPLPKYSGYYSAESKDTSGRYPSVGFPECPATSYRQCSNNVFSPTQDVTKSDDFFDRRNFKESNEKCSYGSTYSSCYPEDIKKEIDQISEYYNRIKKMENIKSNKTGNRVNIYNMSKEVERSDD